MPTDNAEHMIDVSSQEGNTNINNKIPADSASLQTEAIAKGLVPKILQGGNGRLPDLVTNIFSQKRFVSTAEYDESDEGESDRDAGAQHRQMVRTQVPNKLKIWMQIPKNRGKGI